MLAFAGNSILTRLALAPAPPLLDPASFATLRVVSGAVTLVAIQLVRGASGPRMRWQGGHGLIMPLALFVYMIGFSFAYLSLGAGTGALVLFGTVQLTMLTVALVSGERFSVLGWTGLAVAIAGLVWLVAPGATAPDPLGTVLMVAAGLGWAVYSLLGRKAQDPLGTTLWNFVLCVPLVLLVSAMVVSDLRLSADGVALAVASGALTSAVGYALWYAALLLLSPGRAASVQLSVPAIAALGGVLLLAEPMTLRLVIAAGATLGGVGLVLAQRPSPKA